MNRFGLSEEFLEMLEDRPFGMVVAREVFALAEALHGLALPLVEGLGDEDAHLDDEVSRAVAIALDGRQTLAGASCLAACPARS